MLDISAIYTTFGLQYKGRRTKTVFLIENFSLFRIVIMHILLSIFSSMQFSSLSRLDTHITRISTLLNGEQIFVVGGAVRDLLLGISPELSDIDMTLVGSPEALQKRLSEDVPEGMSFFCTEKFGTMTLVSHEGESTLTYELTPFREE